MCLGVSYDSPELGFRAQNRLNSIENATNSYDLVPTCYFWMKNFENFNIIRNFLDSSFQLTGFLLCVDTVRKIIIDSWHHDRH